MNQCQAIHLLDKLSQNYTIEFQDEYTAGNIIEIDIEEMFAIVYEYRLGDTIMIDLSNYPESFFNYYL